MDAIRLVITIGCCSIVFCAGCAVSPDAESRRQAMEADIDEILAYELDPAEFGEAKRCLSDHEYRNFRPLGDRHILFEGRRDKQWINTLRGRCRDLRHGDILVVRSFGGRRMCDMDRFQVSDWFDWPWYRRWPWQWGGSWGTGAMCSLGKFHPVTEAQVSEIEAVLESR